MQPHNIPVASRKGFLFKYPFTGRHASARSERCVAARRDAQRGRKRAPTGHQRAATPCRLPWLHATREVYRK